MTDVHPPRVMTAAEYVDMLQRLNLTHSTAARLLAVDVRTSRRWANDERAVDPSAAQFLRYLIATGRSGDYAMKILESLHRMNEGGDL